MKPWHLELWTLYAHGSIELHEVQAGPPTEGFRQGCKSDVKQVKAEPGIFILGIHNNDRDSHRTPTF